MQHCLRVVYGLGLGLGIRVTLKAHVLTHTHAAPNSAANVCKVVIRKFVNASDNDALNLAEVQLFNFTGARIVIAPNTGFKLSTVLGGLPDYGAEVCNDNNLGNFCHTQPSDKTPQRNITYPCAEGLSKVVVTNRRDP